VLEAAGAPAPMRVGADAAWTLFDGPNAAARPPISDRVVVALSHLAGDRTLADDLAAALAPLVAAGLPVALQPWQTTSNGSADDLQVAYAIADRLPGVEMIAPPADLIAARDTFAQARLVVGLRFHALVAAAAAGTPFVAVAHESKLGALARRFDQACVEPADLRDRLAPLVLGAIDSSGPAPEAVSAEIASAGETLRLLRVLLTAGRSDEADGVDGLTLAPEGWQHI
jgi:polysaccharide pyruvyl transferase WcaK-like protein